MTKVQALARNTFLEARRDRVHNTRPPYCPSPDGRVSYVSALGAKPLTGDQRRCSRAFRLRHLTQSSG